MDPIVNLWTAQEADTHAPSTAELADRARRFRRRLWVRDLTEYVAGALVIAAFGHIAFTTPDWGVRIACATLVAGACIVLRNLWRRRPVEDAAALAADSLAHYRGLLVAQRDTLASVGRWYLAPFVPGMALFIAATVRAQAEASSIAAALVSGGAGAAVIGGIFGLVLWLNRRAARAIDAEIAALDATRDAAIN